MENLSVRLALLGMAGILVEVVALLSREYRKKKDLERNHVDSPLKNVQQTVDIITRVDPPTINELQTEDLISQLPDDVLSSIISRLDVIEAFRTSILSRRWRHVCLLMHSLNFKCYRGDQDCEQLICFANVVNHVLEHYSGCKIASLEMWFRPVDKYIPQFEQWMKVIARKEVEDLALNFMNRKHKRVLFSSLYKSSFPLELISEAAGSLKHLHLFNCNLVLSSGIRFNSLKTLSLWAVPLCRGELPIIFSSCSNLERFEIRNCDLPPIVSINAPHQLKFMIIEYCNGTKSLQISGASLVSFTIIWSFTEKIFELSLCGVPKLKRLNVYDPTRKSPSPRVFCDFAKDLSHLEWLSYETVTNKLEYIDVMGNNAFRNLRQLYFNIEVQLLPNLLNVTPVLEACPVLEKFHMGVNRDKVMDTRNIGKQLARQISNPTNPIQRLPNIRNATSSQDHLFQLWKLRPERGEDRVKTRYQPIPIRHHMHLKEVRLGGFWGTDTDVEFALFFLKRAVVLEQMIISGDYRTYKGDGCWSNRSCHYIEETPREIINGKLQGQAISTIAKVIIDRRGRPIKPDYYWYDV